MYSFLLSPKKTLSNDVRKKKFWYEKFVDDTCEKIETLDIYLSLLAM